MYYKERNGGDQMMGDHLMKNITETSTDFRVTINIGK